MNVISENGIIYSNAVGDKFKAWVDRQNELRQSGQPTAFDKAQNLYQNIQDIRKNLNCGILLISHNLHVVMSQTNHVICLNGHICCSGEPKSIVKNPEYIKLFGENMDPTLAFYKHEHDHHHHPDGSVDHSH